MLLLQHAISFLAISQMLFMGLFYLVFHRKQLLGKLIVVFTFSVTAFILTRLPEARQWPPVSVYILTTLAGAATSLLWVITHELFVDDRRIHPLILLVIAGHIFLWALGNMLTLLGIAISDLEYLIYFQLPRAITLIFAVHVVYMAVRGLKADLIKPRRQLRVHFAITMGLIVTTIVVSGLFSVRLPWLTLVFISVLFIWALFFNIVVFRLHQESPHLLLPIADGTRRVDRRGVDKELVERLHAVMEKDRLYAQQLTVGMLAERMAMREHKLRKLINQKLHYRNFNQYLNHYRINEAARRLLDPAESNQSILTISMEVGYGSQSTFNKTFKELKGVTPSQYRGRGGF